MTEAVALTPRAPDEQASGGRFSAGNWLTSQSVEEVGRRRDE